jgi:hypothetical protein
VAKRLAVAKRQESAVVASLGLHARNLRTVKLYTPLSYEEATKAERGEHVGENLFWLDRPNREEADDDAIWVEIEISPSEAAPFERPFHSELGYREFELPAAVARRHRAKRITLSDES